MTETETERHARWQRGRDTLEILGARFPHLFAMKMWEPHRPLARGIDVDLQAVCPDLPPADLKAAIRCYVSRRMYQAALATPGAMRCRLNGSEQEPVADEHRARAETALRRGDARRAAKAAQAKADRELAKAERKASAPQPPTPEPVQRTGLAGLKAAARARKGNKAA
jgi:sRNA-binding protein